VPTGASGLELVEHVASGRDVDLDRARHRGRPRCRGLAAVTGVTGVVRAGRPVDSDLNRDQSSRRVDELGLSVPRHPRYR